MTKLVGDVAGQVRAVYEEPLKVGKEANLWRNGTLNSSVHKIQRACRRYKAIKFNGIKVLASEINSEGGRQGKWSALTYGDSDGWLPNSTGYCLEREHRPSEEFLEERNNQVKESQYICY